MQWCRSGPSGAVRGPVEPFGAHWSRSGLPVEPPDVSVEPSVGPATCPALSGSSRSPSGGQRQSVEPLDRGTPRKPVIRLHSPSRPDHRELEGRASAPRPDPPSSTGTSRDTSLLDEAPTPQRSSLGTALVRGRHRHDRQPNGTQPLAARRVRATLLGGGVVRTVVLADESGALVEQVDHRDETSVEVFDHGIAARARQSCRQPLEPHHRLHRRSDVIVSECECSKRTRDTPPAGTPDDHPAQVVGLHEAQRQEPIEGDHRARRGREPREVECGPQRRGDVAWSERRALTVRDAAAKHALAGAGNHARLGRDKQEHRLGDTPRVERWSTIEDPDDVRCCRSAVLVNSRSGPAPDGGPIGGQLQGDGPADEWVGGVDPVGHVEAVQGVGISEPRWRPGSQPALTRGPGPHDERERVHGTRPSLRHAARASRPRRHGQEPRRLGLWAVRRGPAGAALAPDARQVESDGASLAISGGESLLPAACLRQVIPPIVRRLH